MAEALAKPATREISLRCSAVRLLALAMPPRIARLFMSSPMDIVHDTNATTMFRREADGFRSRCLLNTQSVDEAKDGKFADSYLAGCFKCLCVIGHRGNSRLPFQLIGFSLCACWVLHCANDQFLLAENSPGRACITESPSASAQSRIQR